MGSVALPLSIRFALSGAGALVLSACGGGHPTEQAEREPLPDPKYLVAKASDFPIRFSLVPAETYPTSLASVLADPLSAGLEAVIRRERVAGYQTAFRSPEAGQIECSAAVYRSDDGADETFGHRLRRFEALFGARSRQLPMIERVGDETAAFRFDSGRLRGLTVAWRYRYVLAACTTLRTHVDDFRTLVSVALAQQQRISGFGLTKFATRVQPSARGSVGRELAFSALRAKWQ